MESIPDELLAAGDDGTPASDDFGDLIVSDCFIPQIVYSTTFGYRTDMVGGTPPDQHLRRVRPETYPGQASLEKRPINNMEWALLCDGVAKEDVYDVLETEEGQAQALAKLDTIKDDVIWWSAGAETPQLLADGEVVMGSTYNGRLFSSVIEEQDQPVAMLWDAQVFDLDGWIIPAGLPEDRLNASRTSSSSPPTRSVWPTRPSTSPTVRHASRLHRWSASMPTSASTWRRTCRPIRNNAKNTFLYNYEWWADYRDDLDAKFQAWLAQ
jgi:putative spermidine/putrescine transport system substrate-binding protein